MGFILDIILDTVKDSVMTLPFLFGAYLIIEYIEHRSSRRFEAMLSKFGPAVGSVLGCVPQCGFSVAAANFYAGRVITLGTLIAVFISTSDEAIPVLIANPGFISIVLPVIAIKVVVALAAGLIVDLLHKGGKREDLEVEAHMHEDCTSSIFKDAVLHTVNIFMFILVISLALNFAIALMGEETLARLLMTGTWLQIPLAALIGFIPNCAASVMLSELFMSGALSFGALIAGLCTGAGTGLAVLFRANGNVKENIRIMGILLVFAVSAGAAIQMFVR